MAHSSRHYNVIRGDNLTFSNGQWHVNGQPIVGTYVQNTDYMNLSGNEIGNVIGNVSYANDQQNTAAAQCHAAEAQRHAGEVHRQVAEAQRQAMTAAQGISTRSEIRLDAQNNNQINIHGAFYRGYQIPPTATAVFIGSQVLHVVPDPDHEIVTQNGNTITIRGIAIYK